MVRRFLKVALLVLLGLPQATAAQEHPWTRLGQTQSEDVTGTIVSIEHYARESAGGSFVLRSEYSRDRHTSEGEAWRTKYLRTLVDCDSRTMTLVRTDYYSSTGEFVSAVPLNIEAPATKLPEGSSWAMLYRFACKLEG